MIFFWKNKRERILIIDIGSSSVNYFIVKKNEGGMNEITGAIHSTYPILEDPDLRHIERHTKKAVREAGEDMRKKYPDFIPEEVFVVVSAPWYYSATKFVKISRKEPFRVDEEIVNKLISDEVDLFLSKTRESIPGTETQDVEILDKEIMRSVVNGYPVKNPFGKETSALEFSIYFSAVKKNFLEGIREILGHFFGSAEVRIISEPLVVYKILMEMADYEEGFLVVDVGGEITEVYLIRKGILESIKNFTWGGNLVVRRLASLLKIDLPEALSFFRVNEKGDLKENIEEKFKPAIDGVCTQWQNFLSESLSEMGKVSPLPQKLILLGGVTGSSILKKCANSEDFASFTILGKPFNVVAFLPENFEGKISLSGMDRKDPYMTLPILLTLGALKYAG